MTIPLMMLLAVFFSPGFKLHAALPLFHIQDLVFFVGILVLVARGTRPLHAALADRAFLSLAKPYFWLLAYTAIVTSVWVLAEGRPFGLVITVFGRFKPLLFACLVYASVQDRPRIRWVEFALPAVAVAETAIMSMQQHGLYGINRWFTVLYMGNLGPDMLENWLSVKRMVGTMSNPNMMATVMSVLGAFAYAATVFHRANRVRVAGAFAALLALYSCVMLNQSRQGTIALLAGCAAVQMVGIALGVRKALVGALLTAILLSAAAMTSVLDMDEDVARRFAPAMGGSTILQTQSLAYRLEYTWPRRWERLRQENGWLMVLGSGKGEDLVGWDSGLLDTFEEAGLLGVVLLLMLSVLPSRAAWRWLRKRGAQNDETWLVAGSAVVFVPLLLTNVVNSTWNNHNVMSVIAVLYAIVFAVMRLRPAPSGVKKTPGLEMGGRGRSVAVGHRRGASALDE